MGRRDLVEESKKSNPIFFTFESVNVMHALYLRWCLPSISEDADILLFRKRKKKKITFWILTLFNNVT